MTDALAIQDNFGAALIGPLLSVFARTTFQISDQAFPAHYGALLRGTNMGWPNEKEIYTARFRHAEMKGNEVVRAVHEAACMKLQCETATAPLVYRMEPGDYFRCHHDGYLGNCGYTYFLNEGWKWDWGGLLNFISPDGEQSEPIFPKSGRILFRDEMESPPHFVSKVEPWALNPQYLIIGFGNR